MSESERNVQADNDRRRVLGLLLASGATATACAAQSGNQVARGDEDLNNSLLWATAWKQTGAEYFALCHQAYNLARLRVDLALAKREPGDAPLAVITDLDNTAMHARSYWGYLINQGLDFFDDAIWDEWLPKNQITAAPGAKDFFDYCAAENVEVFYVTNRDQGERTYAYAMQQLEFLEFPYADDEHLYVFRETSDKSPAREEVKSKFDVVVMLGDNLNDYQRDYYVTGVEERLRLMERDRDHFGREFILLPNPTDGHWVRAIFGDSEPRPTDENRRLLKEAATYLAWDGK